MLFRSVNSKGREEEDRVGGGRGGTENGKGEERIVEGGRGEKTEKKQRRGVESGRGTGGKSGE